MEQQFINVCEVEDATVDRLWTTHGPIVVARRIDDDVARLAVYASRRADHTAQLDECDGDPQDQRCPSPSGSTEELCVLPGESLPSRINDRTLDQVFVAPKANSGEEHAARPVVTCILLVPSISARDNDDIHITYTVGEPEDSDWLIPERDSTVPWVCNEEAHLTAAVLDACMLVEGAQPDTLMAQIIRVVDCTTAEANHLTNRDAMPQHPGAVGHVNEDNLQHRVDLIYDDRIGSDRQDRVNQWLHYRNNERGVEWGRQCSIVVSTATSR